MNTYIIFERDRSIRMADVLCIYIASYVQYLGW